MRIDREVLDKQCRNSEVRELGRVVTVVFFLWKLYRGHYAHLFTTASGHAKSKRQKSRHAAQERQILRDTVVREAANAAAAGDFALPESSLNDVLALNLSDPPAG